MFFGKIATQRRFDFQLAGALKIQLKRGNYETRFGFGLAGFFR
jgi:hypothetical protein